MRRSSLRNAEKMQNYKPSKIAKNYKEKKGNSVILNFFVEFFVIFGA